MMVERSQQAHYRFDPFSSPGELTTKLAQFSGLIASVHYYGHSNKCCFLLDWGIDSRPGATRYWGSDNQVTTVPPRKFVNTAYFASYGCSQGEPAGLAQSIRKLWCIEAIGSVSRPSFSSS